jgi:hypothetical protein
MSTIRPTITWVNDVPSKSGKTVKVLLSHPLFEGDVAHYAYLPIGLLPAKWNVVNPESIKLGDVEVDYIHPDTGMTVELKVPRRQVSFFGSCSLENSPELPENNWVDNRNVVANGDVDIFDDPF